MSAHFDAWRQESAASLKALQPGDRPREVIAALAEGLLAHYSEQPLIDPYDVYQHLTDYWAETMQDDCYLITADGWQAETTRIIEKDKRGREKDKGWTCDLIPKELLVARYFIEEQAALDQLATELEGVIVRLAELEEEHSGEDGAFAELDKVNKVSVAAWMKEIKGDPDSSDEEAVLDDWLDCSKKRTALKKRVKEADAVLDARAYAHYPNLTATEIRTLAVEDKWLAALESAIRGEVHRVGQELTDRVIELADRYATPMPEMVGRVAETGGESERPPRFDGVLMVTPGFKQTEIGVFPDDWETSKLGGPRFLQDRTLWQCATSL